MTLSHWLRGRSPAAPPHLSARIDAALGARLEADARNAAALCLEAAADLLRELLARQTLGRESALDLLAVDALTTYAFEAASTDPATLPMRAADGMRALASTACT